VPLELGSGPVLVPGSFTRAPGQAKGSDEVIPLVRLAPQYPYRARRDGVEGWVELRFTITAKGTVKNIEVVKSKPRGVFDKAARKAMAKWRFKPRTVDGLAVERQATQKLTFSLDQ